MLEQSPQRLIKRYPNRRLYDVQASKYVNLADVRQLVVEGVTFRVLVDKTNEDQTKNVLMQILVILYFIIPCILLTCHLMEVNIYGTLEMVAQIL